MKRKKFGTLRKVIAMLLVVVIAVAVVPARVTTVSGAEVELIFAPDDNLTAASPGALIIEFADLSEEVANQTVPFGTALTALDLPAVLTATMGAPQAYTITVPVGWSSTPEFEGFAGVHIFTAAMQGDYAVAEGVKPPVITVTVEPVGITPLNQTFDNVATIADLQTAAGQATSTSTSTINLADNFLGDGTVNIPPNSTVIINSNVLIDNGLNGLTFNMDSGSTVIWNAHMIRTVDGIFGTIMLSGGGNFVINGTISRSSLSIGSIALVSAGPNVTINPTGIVQNNSSSGLAIVINSTSSITLNGGTVQSNTTSTIDIRSNAASLVVNSGTIINDGTGFAIAVDFGTATINGGTINGGLNHAGGTIYMYGGTTRVLTSAQLTAALTAVNNAGASADATIRLGQSFVHPHSILIDGGRNVTFDLNGYTLDVDAPQVGFSGNPAMTVSGTGTVVNCNRSQWKHNECDSSFAKH